MTAHLSWADIVQLNPETCRNKALAGCFLIVDQVYPWGVQGYVQQPGSTWETAGGAIWYRARDFEFLGPVGKAIWVAE